MSITYRIFTPLSPRECLELQQQCDRAGAEYMEEHPDFDDDSGELDTGTGSLPSAEDVKRTYADLEVGDVAAFRHQEREFPLAEVLERLSRCHSGLRIDHPGDIEWDGGMQVSILRFLLERAGEALVDFEVSPYLVRSEDLLRELATKRGAPGFGRAGRAAAPKQIKRRHERPGEARALRIRAMLAAARDDVQLAIDVKAALRSVSDTGRRYAALFLEQGAMSDGLAAKALATSPDAACSAAIELDRALEELY